MNKSGTIFIKNTWEYGKEDTAIESVHNIFENIILLTLKTSIFPS